MKKFLIINLISVSIILTGCTTSAPTNEACSLTESTGNSCSAETGLVTPTTTLAPLDVAKTILQAIKNNDLPTLATFVGPQGLRFSPYAYVNTGTDVVLTSGEVHNGLAISRSYTWGVSDGSGEPIDLGIGQYFEKFIYDLDFLSAPEINENKEIIRGNIVNNIFDVYSGDEIIEFYIPGVDPKYEGMDRRSLTLVLEKTDEKWYLIGIIHNQRTI